MCLSSSWVSEKFSVILTFQDILYVQVIVQYFDLVVVVKYPLFDQVPFQGAFSWSYTGFLVSSITLENCLLLDFQSLIQAMIIFSVTISCSSSVGMYRMSEPTGLVIPRIPELNPLLVLSWWTMSGSNQHSRADTSIKVPCVTFLDLSICWKLSLSSFFGRRSGRSGNVFSVKLLKLMNPVGGADGGLSWRSKVQLCNRERNDLRRHSWRF